MLEEIIPLQPDQYKTNDRVWKAWRKTPFLKVSADMILQIVQIVISHQY